MFLRIVISQIRHNWGVTLLIFLAMTALVTLYVFANNMATFSNRSMQLVMKNMGHNLLILTNQADPGVIYRGGNSLPLFAEDVTQQMSERLDLSSRYYVSVLQQEIEVTGNRIVLTGIEPIAREDETREKRNFSIALSCLSWPEDTPLRMPRIRARGSSSPETCSLLRRRLWHQTRYTCGGVCKMVRGGQDRRTQTSRTILGMGPIL